MGSFVFSESSMEKYKTMLCLTTINGASWPVVPEINVPYMVSVARMEAATPTTFSSAPAWRVSTPQMSKPGIRKTGGPVAVFGKGH